MSEKKHEKVSLLDLPGFGSTIGTLRKELRKQFNWPIEMNFAALKNNPRKNISSIFTSYKSLIDDWANHMKNLDNNNYKNTFTREEGRAETVSKTRDFFSKNQGSIVVSEALCLTHRVDIRNDSGLTLN